MTNEEKKKYIEDAIENNLLIENYNIMVSSDLRRIESRARIVESYMLQDLMSDLNDEYTVSLIADSVDGKSFINVILELK